MSAKFAKPCVLIILALALAACATTSAQTATDVPTVEYPLPTFPSPTEIIASPEPARATVWPSFAQLPLPVPNGFATFSFDPANASLNLFDLQAQSVAVLNLPPTASSIKVVGGLPAGAVTLPLVYFEWEQHELVLDQGGSVSKLADVPHFVAMAAAVGQPVLAYSSIEYLNDGATTSSHLYVGTPQSLASALPALSVADTESYAITPLAVRSEAGQPVGVWYTWEPQGIGGEIVFAPRSGLFYLELVNGTNHEILGRGVNPSAVSPELAWLAFTTAVVSPLNIRNLSGGQEVTFPLLADSDRGAGNAFFAPDSQHVAWMEAGGTRAADPPTFHVTIRIATTAGQIVADVPGATVIDFAGSGGEVVNVRPVGWLDGQTLILQVYSTYASKLLRVNFDGSGLDHLAPGSLVGLLYP
jgi:hypothetical protein